MYHTRQSDALQRHVIKLYFSLSDWKPSVEYSAFNQRKPAPSGVKEQYTCSPIYSPAAHMLYEDVTVCVCVFVCECASFRIIHMSTVHWVHMSFEQFICLSLLHYSSLRWASIADLGWLTMTWGVCIFCVCVWTHSMTHSVLLDRWGQQYHRGQRRFYTRKIAT